jgi:hypothetical protein
LEFLTSRVTINIQRILIPSDIHYAFQANFKDSYVEYKQISVRYTKQNGTRWWCKWWVGEDFETGYWGLCEDTIPQLALRVRIQTMKNL